MDAQLCASVTGATTAELRLARDRADTADLVELRLDFVRDPDVAGALADRRRPVIVTCRPRWEGGVFDGSEEERRRLLAQALDLGAEFVDLEWSGAFDDVIRSRSGRNIVLSTHHFDGLPGDLADEQRAMCGTGAEVVKIAVQTTKLGDLLTLRDLPHPPAGTRRVLVGMGAPGVPSRLLPDRFGSCWTYAGDGVAPGQIPLGDMLELFRVRDVTDDTAVYGVLGKPVGHSLSPAMHNAGFAAAGANAVYMPLEARDGDDFLAFAAALPLAGASVTAPFKETMAERLDKADALTRRLGSVNTLRPLGTGWQGINTDVAGFLAPLSSRIELQGCRAAVLGAGGAARGVVAALADKGAAVTVYARRVEQAAAVAALVDGSVGRWPPPAGSWDLLVNTTPIGTHPAVDESPLPGGPFDGRLVYDLVYNPRMTRLLSEAASAGCDTLGGLEMLVAQAEQQFAWWTGHPPASDEFMRAAERRLAQQQPLTTAEAS